MAEVEDDNSSTQFLQLQKNQLLDWQEDFERYCITFLNFGFNSARYDINFIKSYVLPIVVNEWDVESILIEQGKQFVSFKFANVHVLDIFKFLGSATDLDSFLKAYKTSETQGLFPYECFNRPGRLNGKKHPSYEAFHNKLRVCYPLEKEYLDCEKLIESGLTTESALVKMKYHLLEQRTIPTCRKRGNKKKCSHSKAFCAGIFAKTLSQH